MLDRFVFLGRFDPILLRPGRSLSVYGAGFHGVLGHVGESLPDDDAIRTAG